MKIYKTTGEIIIVNGEDCFIATEKDWDTFINRDDLWNHLQTAVKLLPIAGNLQWLGEQQLRAPIGSQEIWAAGVTYLRSKEARMEESQESGGATFYDKVYHAERPELFFKSVASKVIGPGGRVRIRKDSSWNVPEPELVLVITRNGKIIGYSIGNDMSSRSIEGENPLYLPQAKTYDGSAAIGPCVLILETPISPDTLISINITRAGASVYTGSVEINMMKRNHEELVQYLYRESSFETGAYLMTGTCLVPEDGFTLAPNDVIEISISGIGKLIGTVVQ